MRRLSPGVTRTSWCFCYHKPAGEIVLVWRLDRPSVLLCACGRPLDCVLTTEGLLLFTTSGEVWLQSARHPRYEIGRRPPAYGW